MDNGGEKVKNGGDKKDIIQSSVTTAAATGRPLDLAAPLQIYLGLGSTFLESLSV